MFFNPLEQFEIIQISSFSFKIFTIQLLLTNSTYFTILALLFLIILFLLLTFFQAIIPTKWQSLIEIFFNFILNDMVNTIISGYKAQKNFTFVFLIFIANFATNLIGMIPYSFTISSHLIITFYVAFIIYIGSNLKGFKEHGVDLIELVLPTGAPMGMIPFLILIELVSYLFKPISLSVRLFANLMAGHILLKVIAGFAWTLMLSSSSIISFLSIPTIIILIILIGLELAVSFIQAYVFTILTCMFINDAKNLH